MVLTNSCSEMEKLLENVAEEEGFSNYNMEQYPGSCKGDGYLGIITAIRITGTKKTDNKNEELHLIVKSAPESDVLRSRAPISNLYKREIYMYNVVLPIFQKFELQKGLSPSISLPKCYKTCMIENSEMLIMENLKCQGYNMWERGSLMEHHHVAFIMEEYGRFHALSYALRDQDLDTFQKVTKSMHNIFNEFWKMGTKSQVFINRCKKAVDTLDPKTNKRAFEVYKKFVGDDNIDQFERRIASEVDEFSVILHGDCWFNNMMFKYEDENQTKITKMCLIDFQTSRLSSPVIDLSYFLYASSSKSVINNYEDYLNIYYNSLCSYLKILGSNPDSLYPYSVFRQHWKEFSKFGLMSAIVLQYLKLAEENDVSNPNLADTFDYFIENSDVYYDRIRDIILHFVENDFI